MHGRLITHTEDSRELRCTFHQKLRMRLLAFAIGAAGTSALAVPLPAHARTPCVVRSHVCMQSVGPPYAGPRSSPLLDQVDSPKDMKQFTMAELKQLTHELRWEVITAVSKTGGHLGSSLGVVELTVGEISGPRPCVKPSARVKKRARGDGRCGAGGCLDAPGRAGVALRHDPGPCPATRSGSINRPL